jgi:hypothetical protein
MPYFRTPRAGFDSLASLRNEETQAVSLYVMQNEFGAIKIGRSAQPEDRKRQLSQELRCKIKLVTVMPKAGHREEWCHLQMAEHSLAGEWFAGYAASRAQVEKLLAATLAWPYDVDEAGLAEWLERIRDVRGIQYWRKRERTVIRQLLGALRGTSTQREYLDGSIALLSGFSSICSTGKTESGYDGIRGKGREVEPVPAYTHSFAAAKLLWPDDASQAEPTTTDPIEYCLEALCEAWGFDHRRLTPLDGR